MGIRYQLSFYFILLSTVTVITAGFFVLSSVIDDKKNYVIEINSFLGPQIAESLDQKVNSIKVELLSLHALKNTEFLNQLTKIKTQFPEVKAIFIGDGASKLKTLSLVNDPEGIAQIERVSEQLKQAANLPVIAGQLSHLFDDVYAITDKNLFIAVVLHSDFYKSAFQLARGRPVALINRQKGTLYNQNSTDQQIQVYKKIPAEVWQNAELMSTQVESDEHTGHLVNFARPKNLNNTLIAVLAATPRASELLKPIIKPSIGIFIMLILLSMLTAYLISQKMAAPIEGLADWANQIGLGQWHELKLQNTGPEIETLSKSFHNMMENLKSRENDLKQANQKIVHAESLAAVGRMSAGIAHEVKNPLGSILGYAQLINIKIAAQKKTGDVAAVIPTVENYVNLVIDDTRRANKIISDLLTFARQKEVERHQLSVAEFVKTITLKLLSYGETHQTKLIIDKTAVKAKAGFDVDSEQLYQVIFNLTQNAIHAVSQKPENERLVEIKMGTDSTAVNIDVKDNGSGIEPENLKKIFEPFFSTKKVGEGSGLGLAICHGIILQHGGSIDVESVVGQSTCFKIKLPLKNLS